MNFEEMLYTNTRFQKKIIYIANLLDMLNKYLQIICT